MIEVPLKNSDLTTLIDEEDADLVSAGVKLGKGGYAYFCKKNATQLHVKIMEKIIGHEIPRNFQVDHKNRNPLDNTRRNLRLATPSQNQQNKEASARVKYKGVYKRPHGWKVMIGIDNKSFTVGIFSNEEIAALAYDNAARLYHDPQFACLNFPDRFMDNVEIEKFRVPKGGIPRSASGIRGIRWDKRWERWYVSLCVNKKLLRGSSKSLDEAIQILAKFKQELGVV